MRPIEADEAMPASRSGSRRPMAGTPVEVFIRTGARTPANYLMKPIADYFHRALREA